MINLELPKAGREYARLALAGLPPGAPNVEARIGETGTWTPVELVGNLGRVLLRGPNATGTEGVLVATSSFIDVRLTDNPEIVLRRAGRIILV